MKYNFVTQRCKNYQINNTKNEIISALIFNIYELHSILIKNKIKSNNSLYEKELLINALTFISSDDEIKKQIEKVINKIFIGIK